MAERGWHNPAKEITKKTKGKCPYCGREVNSLENHIHDMNMNERK